MQVKWMIAAAVTLAVAAACSKKAAGPQVEAALKAEPIEIRAAAAETRQVDRFVNVTGSLHPDETVQVSSEVAGRVASIHVDFGQQVRAGDVVAELDKRELQLQHERAKAALAQALARIGLDANQEDVNPSTTPGIRQAEAQYLDSRSKFESAQRLIATGDVSRERYNELEKTMNARQASLDAARDDLRTQMANIQALRAEVKLAAKRLSDATVRAPFDGSVGARLVSPGQYLNANTAILTLVKTNPLRLRVDIPETGAAAVRAGSVLTFTTDAVPGREYRAAVRELNPSLDERSRSLAVEARLTEGDPRLRPGMFVQVKLVVQHNAEVVVVPSDSISTVAGLSKLFVIAEGRVKEHRLTPGMSFDGWVEVPAGLVKPGNLVATSKLTSLVDGADVVIAGEGRPRS